MSRVFQPTHTPVGSPTGRLVEEPVPHLPKKPTVLWDEEQKKVVQLAQDAHNRRTSDLYGIANKRKES